MQHYCEWGDECGECGGGTHSSAACTGPRSSGTSTCSRRVGTLQARRAARSLDFQWELLMYGWRPQVSSLGASEAPPPALESPSEVCVPPYVPVFPFLSPAGNLQSQCRFVLGPFLVLPRSFLGPFWGLSTFLPGSSWVASGLLLGSFSAPSGSLLESFKLPSRLLPGSPWAHPGLLGRAHRRAPRGASPQTRGCTPA